MLELLSQHITEASGIFALVIIIAERVARLTPTRTDDRILKALRGFARLLALDVKDNRGKRKGIGDGLKRIK